MLTISEVVKLLHASTTSVDASQPRLSKVHYCLIKGIAEDGCILSELRGLPHVVLYILNLVEDFTTTLRNINYVMQDPGQNLLVQYAEALKYASGQTKIALQQWLKFVNVYGPFMIESPSSSFSLAMNQLSSSFVYLDTKEMEGKSVENLPLNWLNRPQKQHDSVLMRYTDGMDSMFCVATSVQGNLIAFTVANRVLVYQMNTGILQYQLEIEDPIVAFGNGDSELLVSDEIVGLQVREAETGTLKWSYHIDIPILLDGEEANDWIIFMQYVGESIVLGTYAGNVQFILSSAQVVIDTWTVGEEANTYCYHPSRHWLLSGHDTRVIKCWTISGVLMKTIQVEGRVVSLAVHLTDNNAIASTIRSGDLSKHDEHIQLNIETGAVVSTVAETNNGFGECGSFIAYMLHHGKVRLVCICKEWILVCNDDGEVVSSVGRFNEGIHKLCLVPDTNYVLATGEYDCYLYDLAGFCDERNRDGISCCAFLQSGDHFITLSQKGQLAKWSTNNFERTSLVIEDKSYRFMMTHPIEDVVILVCREKFLILETGGFQTVSNYIMEGAGQDISDMVISENGEKLVLACYSEGTSVYDISDFGNIHLIAKHAADQNQTADIHRDGQRVLSMGENGIELWHLSADQQVSSLSRRSGSLVRFMYDPDCIVCVTFDTDVLLLTLDGDLIRKLNVTTSWVAHLISNKYLISGDNYVQLHDLHNGRRCKSVFYHHPSADGGFTCFAISPDRTIAITGNLYGEVYALNLQSEAVVM